MGYRKRYGKDGWSGRYVGLMKYNLYNSLILRGMANQAEGLYAIAIYINVTGHCWTTHETDRQNKYEKSNCSNQYDA